MDTHQIFRKHILPTLLTIAKRSHSLGSIVSISLYGSANYGPYDKDTSRKGFDSEKSDYAMISGWYSKGTTYRMQECLLPNCSE